MPMSSTLASARRRQLEYFPSDYFSARERFTTLASILHARTDSHAIQARGPGGETLSIDTAYLGGSAPRRLLIISSAIHGAEGFAGSALQQGFISDLADVPPLPDDRGVLFVHAINPYGFAHLRRANENNVDLNRNCLTSFPGPANPAYEAFNALLNPPASPSMDLFILRLAGHALRLGPGTFTQIIAAGQYTFPKGLFYGGTSRQESIAVFDRILRRPSYARVASVLHIDLHTGLGRYGTYKLLAQVPSASPEFLQLQEWFGTDAVATNLAKTAGAYAASGLIGSVTKAAFANARVYTATLEFGTYSLPRVLASLRKENSLQHYGLIDSTTGRKIKAQFLESFCPQDKTWRFGVLEQGINVLRQAKAGLFA